MEHDTFSVREDPLAAVKARPWPTDAAIEYYADILAAGKPDLKHIEDIEHNAMVSIINGDYDGPEGADAAHRYRLLSEKMGTRSIAALRPLVPAFIDKIRREQFLIHSIVHIVSNMHKRNMFAGCRYPFVR